MGLAGQNGTTARASPPSDIKASGQQTKSTGTRPPTTHQGRPITDATVAPQDITFPTDLKLPDAARIKSEGLIDIPYDPLLRGGTKPRTYRNIARKLFLNTAKKKHKTGKAIYRPNGQQLRFLKRNLAHIEALLKGYGAFPLKPKEQKYLMVLHTVYDQQKQVHHTHAQRIDGRIVNIHQPRMYAPSYAARKRQRQGLAASYR